MQHTVIFQPSGRRGKINAGTNLLDAARELGVDIESVCGGVVVCGKCKVKIEEGFFEKFGIESSNSHLSPMTDDEKDFLEDKELEENYRLACMAEVHGDVLVFVPEESRGAKQVVLETGKDRVFDFDPAIKKYYLELPPATLEDYRDDVVRIKEAMEEKYGFGSDLTIDYYTLRNLPNVIREGNWKITVTVWQGREIIKVEPNLVPKSYGVAIDVGTTTIAAYLCDLQTGEVLDRESMMNPQVRYGEDVLARITYSMMNEGGLERMKDAVIEGLNTLIQRLADKAVITTDDVLEVVIVFNTAMHHILLGIEPKHMGRSPFAPAIRRSLDIKARDLGINICPSGNIHVLPVEAGFVGPDNVAVLIAEEPYKRDEQALIIDIGTNGEINFGNKERLYCTSCATGPALEGAQIKFGMRAAPGAIEKVAIDPETKEAKVKVIGEDDWHTSDMEPSIKGICGSGIIDVIAEMFKAGIILKSGKINTKIPSPRIRKGEDGKPEYVLVWAKDTSIGKDITVTQADVRAVQLAKAALYVGAKFLMRHAGVEKIDSVTLAGAFGSYINKESAMVIGMFPNCDLDKVQAVGNAAGDGAKLALLDRKKREEAQFAADFTHFVETAVEDDFQTEFSLAMAFPHAKDPFPQIQHILDRIPK